MRPASCVLNAAVAIACLAGFSAHAASVGVEQLRADASGSGISHAADPGMPWVRSADINLVRRINGVMYIEQFETLPPARKPADIKALMQPAAKLGTAGKITPQKYTVRRNDEAVLVLDIALESCGAYCEEFWARYAFDLRTGRRLLLADLLTPAGTTAVGKLLEIQRLAALKTAALEKRKAAKSAADAQARQGYEAAATLYEDCAAQAGAPDLARFSWQLDTGGIAFFKERCSNHAMRALDDLGDYQQILATDALRPHLTPYGKALLMHEKTVPLPTERNMAGQLLQGKLNGRIPVSMMMGLPRKTGEAALPTVYFHDQYRKPINLVSAVQKNGPNLAVNITMTESASTDNPQPYFEAAMLPGRISGRWVGKAGSLRFEAMP